MQLPDQFHLDSIDGFGAGNCQTVVGGLLVSLTSMACLLLCRPVAAVLLPCQHAGARQNCMLYERAGRRRLSSSNVNALAPATVHRSSSNGPLHTSHVAHTGSMVSFQVGGGCPGPRSMRWRPPPFAAAAAAALQTPGTRSLPLLAAAARRLRCGAALLATRTMCWRHLWQRCGTSRRSWRKVRLKNPGICTATIRVLTLMSCAAAPSATHEPQRWWRLCGTFCRSQRRVRFTKIREPKLQSLKTHVRRGPSAPWAYCAGGGPSGHAAGACTG